eukprot:4263686-Lingulodinium_polyedra.AAC.1
MSSEEEAAANPETTEEAPSPGQTASPTNTSAPRPTRTAQQQRAGLTGELRDFATLAMTRSAGPTENIKA